MQRQSNRQSAQPRDSIEYDALDYQEPLYQHDTILRCKFPKYPRRSSNKKERYTIAFLTWLCLVAFFAFLAVAVAFTVKFLIDTDTGFDPHSPDFALYKNSRFQECLATVPPDAATCSDIQANLLSLGPSNYPQFTDQGISVVVQPYLVSRNRTAGNGNDPVTYGWCQAVSCLAGFQIVPSTPRGSAFMVTPLIW